MILTSLDMVPYLRDVAYPERKINIMTIAKEQGASSEILEVLKEIPDGRYVSLHDLVYEIEEMRGGHDEDT